MAQGDGTPVAVTHRAIFRVSPDTLSIALPKMVPGDIFLKHSDGGVVSRLIAYFQRLHGYDEKAKNITHVSMYMGDGKLFHAVYAAGDPANSVVRMEDVIPYYQGHTVSIVRGVDPKNTQLQSDLVKAAIDLAGAPYDMKALLAGAISPQTVRTLANRLGFTTDAAIEQTVLEGQICSTAVFEVYLRTLREKTPLYVQGAHNSAPFLLPASYYGNPLLKDIANRLP